MAWQTGNYAKVWEIEHKSDSWAKVQLSTSRRIRETGEYETDFSRWVDFRGTSNVQHLSRHKAGDRIKLGDVAVTTPKKPDGSGYYENFICWSFEDADGGGSAPANRRASKPADSGEIDDDGEEYPFD